MDVGGTKVGIGTTSPDATLDVGGDIRIGNGQILSQASGTAAVHFNNSQLRLKGTTLRIDGVISSSLNPSGNESNDIGHAGAKWRELYVKDIFSSGDTNLGGAVQYSTASISHSGSGTFDYTADSGSGKDTVIFCDTSAGSIDVTIPAAELGRKLICVKTSASNQLTVKDGTSGGSSGDIGQISALGAINVFSSATQWYLAD